jgi:hypothetical protein
MKGVPSVAAVWLVLLAALLAAPSAMAQVSTQDSVTRSATTGLGRGFTAFTFDVHSAPSGENPTGTVVFDTIGGRIGPLDVTCLTVSRNRASMIFEAPPNVPADGVAVFVEDDGPGQDRIDFHLLTPLTNDCPVPSQVLEPTVFGDVTVVDAQPPNTDTQCRQAGWVAYGYANHAQCIDAVHQLARRKCIFERTATGITAFRAKYGVGPNDDYAMRRCVRLYTGF